MISRIKKTIIVLLTLLVLSFKSDAQVPPLRETRIVVNKMGDTVLLINLSDARIILSDLLDKPIVDSLLAAYKTKDDESGKVIALYKHQIELLQTKSDNQELQMKNLNQIINNKDVEIKFKNSEITQLRKEVKKQKAVKKIAISAAIILPLLILFYK